MLYRVLNEKRPNTVGLDNTIVILLDSSNGTAAEIWPALGFNCIRWQTTWQGQVLDLLYADQKIYEGAKSTRSGIPILFPFPNRIRGGRFTWEGKEYQLPINDSSGPNAIHGFACRKPWRVIDQGANDSSAWITGEFRASIDAPEAMPFWPADYALRVTYRLTASGLFIESVVSNPDNKRLPFGLGFHPYTRVPLRPGLTDEDYWLDCAAREYWQLEEGLPNGKRIPVDEARDLTTGQWLARLSLDDVLTDLADHPYPLDQSLYWRGSLRQTTDNVKVQMLTTESFRNVVVFTPPHRQAVCLEPYTCITDAINLQQQGVDAGLIVLEPGAEWKGTVVLQVQGAQVVG